MDVYVASATAAGGDLARDAADRCLARALLSQATTRRGRRELADLLLDARALAIAMADAAVASARPGEGLPALGAAAEQAAERVFLSAVAARDGLG